MKTVFTSLIAQRSLFSNRLDISRGRIIFVLLAFLGVFSAMSVRLFFATVISSHVSGLEVGGMRGHIASRQDIVDRNGQLLASSILTSSVYANPKMITNPTDVARKLKKIFPGLDETQLLTKLKSSKSFIWIKRLITPNEQQLINDAGLLGVYFETNERRAYTYGRLFSHVIGSVGLDGEGLSGMEKSFDLKLRHTKPDGTNAPLMLSVDASLQSIVREELKNAVAEFSAKGGVGIVQDPNNGEILALVSLPDFNPHAIAKADENDVFNKATLGIYEVGSVFKPFTVAAALDSDKVRLNDVYDVDAPIHFARFRIKDFQKKKAWLSVPEILMYSSNIGTAQIALELGKKNQFNYLKAFGFLEPSMIEMTEKSRPLYPAASKWSDLSCITISYGNGISVSPLHVVNATSALVNGGKLFPATIIKTSGEASYVRAVKESTSEVMRKLLRLIVKHGSGRKSDVEGYFVGGKSGTSNVVVNGKYSESARISSFVAAFPIHSPKFVVYIMLDEPKSTKDTYGFATGGWIAAPVVSKIITRMTILYNMLPELSDKEKVEQNLHVNYCPNKAV